MTLPRTEVLRLALLDAAKAFRLRCASMAADVKPMAEDINTTLIERHEDIPDDELSGVFSGIRLTAEWSSIPTVAPSKFDNMPHPNR